MKSSLSHLTNFTNYESIADSLIDDHCRNEDSTATGRTMGKLNFRRSFSCQFLTRALHELCEDPRRGQNSKYSASEIQNRSTPLPTPISSSISEDYNSPSSDNQVHTKLDIEGKTSAKGLNRSRVLQIKPFASPSQAAFQNSDNNKTSFSSNVERKTCDDKVCRMNPHWVVPSVSSTSAQLGPEHLPTGKLIDSISKLENIPHHKESNGGHVGNQCLTCQNPLISNKITGRVDGPDMNPRAQSPKDIDDTIHFDEDKRQAGKVHEFPKMSLRELRQVFGMVDIIMENAQTKVMEEFLYPWSEPKNQEPKNEQNGRNQFASPIFSFEKHDRYVQVYRFGDGSQVDNTVTLVRKARKIGVKHHVEQVMRSLLCLILLFLYSASVLHFHLYLTEQRNQFWQTFNNDGDH